MKCIVTGRDWAAVAEYSVLKECIRKFYFAGQKEDLFRKTTRKWIRIG